MLFVVEVTVGSGGGKNTEGGGEGAVPKVEGERCVEESIVFGVAKI